MQLAAAAHAFTAYYCASTLAYSGDQRSGRCRLSVATFKKLSIAVGWVVRLDFGLLQVLCTAWPDSAGFLCKDNSVVFDDTVRRGDASQQTVCHISVVCLPKLLSSVRIAANNGGSGLPITSSRFVGLPAQAGFSILDEVSSVAGEFSG
jgi:hypothetical protein